MVRAAAPDGLQRRGLWERIETRHPCSFMLDTDVRLTAGLIPAGRPEETNP